MTQPDKLQDVSTLNLSRFEASVFRPLKVIKTFLKLMIVEGNVKQETGK